MAEHDKPGDVDKLLAEVDGMLAGEGPSPTRSVQPDGTPEPSPSWLARRTRAAAVSGAVAAVVVWLAFAILPFLRATSGAAGAFLAAFVAVLVLPRRR